MACKMIFRCIKSIIQFLRLFSIFRLFYLASSVFLYFLLQTGPTSASVEINDVQSRKYKMTVTADRQSKYRTHIPYVGYQFYHLPLRLECFFQTFLICFVLSRNLRAVQQYFILRAQRMIFGKQTWVQSNTYSAKL